MLLSQDTALQYSSIILWMKRNLNQARLWITPVG